MTSLPTESSMILISIDQLMNMSKEMPEDCKKMLKLRLHENNSNNNDN